MKAELNNPELNLEEFLEIDSHFIRVKDKFGYIQNISLSSIVSFEELNSGGYEND